MMRRLMMTRFLSRCAATGAARNRALAQARTAVCWSMLLMLAWPLSVHALANAIIKVKTVPEELYENQAFNLIFQTFQSVDGPPDFSPLDKDFTIVSQTQRNAFKMFSGDFERSDNWVLELVPDRGGTITIPPIAFGKDRSPSLQLHFKPRKDQQGNRDFLSEMEVSADSVFVRSQIIVTRRMLSRKRTARPNFSDLKTEGVDVLIETLQENRAYDISRDGIDYHVLEQRYALFPLQAGSLRIQPSIAIAQVAASGDGHVNPLMSNSITVQAASSAIDIEVKAIPAPFKSATWLPATAVELSEDWNQQDEYPVGAPIMRNIVITAQGQTATQIPPLHIEPVAHLKHYPDQPTLHDSHTENGIVGKRDTHAVWIPTQAGQYTLPAIEMPWWNTQSQRAETSRLPARQIKVVGTPANDPLNLIDHIPNRSTVTELENRARLYLWLAIALGVAWLGSVAYLLNRARSPAQQAAAPRQETGKNGVDVSQARKTLELACASGDARQCEAALLQWARAVAGDKYLTSLGALADYAGGAFSEELLRLEAALYSNQPGDWHPDRIWQHAAAFKPQHSRQQDDSALEPMYR